MDKKTDNIEPQQPDNTLLHDFSKAESSPLFTWQFIALLFFFVVLGIGSGYMLSQSGKGKSPLSVGSFGKGGVSSEAKKGTVVGSDDTKTFKDTTEGVLQKEGKNGEGQFHLVRPGGESQYVYLTSSIVDLSQFVNVKIKVWGETQKARKVGWLMDVGRVEVLE